MNYFAGQRLDHPPLFKPNFDSRLSRSQQAQSNRSKEVEKGPCLMFDAKVMLLTSRNLIGTITVTLCTFALLRQPYVGTSRL